MAYDFRLFDLVYGHNTVVAHLNLDEAIYKKALFLDDLIFRRAMFYEKI